MVNCSDRVPPDFGEDDDDFGELDESNGSETTEDSGVFGFQVLEALLLRKALGLNKPEVESFLNLPLSEQEKLDILAAGYDRSKLAVGRRICIALETTASYEELAAAMMDLVEMTAKVGGLSNFEIPEPPSQSDEGELDDDEDDGFDEDEDGYIRDEDDS